MNNISFIIISLLIIVSCNNGTEKDIVYIEPIQCLGNPWDAAWLETHDYEDYPHDEDEQLKIFTDYYEAQGVKMYHVYTEWVYDAVCGACFCPTGQRIYCQVDEGEVDFLLEFGFSQH